MSMRKRIIKRYSEAFKKEVVREYLSSEFSFINEGSL